MEKCWWLGCRKCGYLSELNTAQQIDCPTCRKRGLKLFSGNLSEFEGMVADKEWPKHIPEYRESTGVANKVIH